jgi:hypothetical protein
MFILTCMYIILAILEKIIQYINIYLFIYWIIFSSYNLWTSCKKSLKILKGQSETIYRRSIDMNINAYVDLVHTSISIDMNINAYFYIVVLTILRHYCFVA